MIKLVTVIGHGTNLIEHHIKHYSKYVDEIQYVVYETDLHPTLLEDVKKITKPYGNVKIVKTINERIFDWEKVTELYNEIKLTKPNDWWVIADIDEFHLYPENSLNLLISDCDKNGWEIVRGGFIDRIGRGGEFSELVLNKSLSSVVILLGLIVIGVIIFLLWCGLMNLLMKVLLKSKK